MALGTKDSLSLSDEHDSDRSLSLNVLLCLLRVLCSGWWSLYKVVSNLLRVLLSAIVWGQSVVRYPHTHTHTTIIVLNRQGGGMVARPDLVGVCVISGR